MPLIAVLSTKHFSKLIAKINPTNSPGAKPEGQYVIEYGNMEMTQKFWRHGENKSSVK